ncbi:MAG: hypothetical protein GWP10_15910 [Nitrospiraceae bacterium]|nr:hypothetical protein [Nitrospiraceae bacterium]
MTANEEIRRIMGAFDLYEHPTKPDLFRKKLNVRVEDESSGRLERIDVTLYADFRKTDTGQFYSDPSVPHENIPLIQEIKDAIAKLPENRDSATSETPGETKTAGNSNTSVQEKSSQTHAPPARQDGENRKKEVKVLGLDMPIPALGMTMREMGFHVDIDYYLSTDGSQITLAKEGITKLAAFASRLPKKPIMISDEYEEIEFERDDNGQITKIRLRGKAWIGSKDNPERLITDEIDWDWSSAVTRAVIKNVQNGERLRREAEHKKFGLPKKDQITLEKALSPDEIEYNQNGMLVPKEGVPAEKILPLMSYLADVREFALRTCVGKMRSRMWSELLGLRSLSAKEARIMMDDVRFVEEDSS